MTAISNNSPYAYALDARKFLDDQISSPLAKRVFEYAFENDENYGANDKTPKEILEQEGLSYKAALGHGPMITRPYTKKPSYPNEGNEEYNLYPLLDNRLKASLLIQQHYLSLKLLPNDAYRLLDVGGGNGGLPLQ